MFPSTRKRFTAYVIFYGSEHDGFWRIFTGRGWRHCCVILPSYGPEDNLLRPDVASLVINPLTWGVEALVIRKHPEEVCRLQLEDGATAAISIPIDLRHERLYVPRGLLTCVSLIKAVLGMRGGWYVFTPKHLARYMLRHGGKFIGKSHG